MAREHLTLRVHRTVFVPTAAAAQALDCTGSLIEIQHKVEKVEALPLQLALQHDSGQPVVLLKNSRQILFAQRIGQRRVADHRLHRHLIEAQIHHMQNILRKVQIVARKRPADIIILIPALCHKLPVFGNDSRIASLTAGIRPHRVIDLRTAIERKHDIVHFRIEKIHDFLVEQNAVGGHCKAELLAGFFFPFAGIGHRLPDHVEVHQRLPAEKVQLQMPASDRFFNQKIDGRLRHVKAHHLRLAAVNPLPGKTILAAEVAVVRHMQAHRLKRGRHHAVGKLRIVVLAEQQAVFLEFQQFAVGFLYIVSRIFFAHRVQNM